MKELFNATVSWRILAYFFENPLKEEHVKAIARNLRIGAGSASTCCKALHENGLVKKKARGNSLFYSLRNESAFVKRLKSAWFLHKLMRFGSAWEHEEFVSVALYGSRASGEYIEKSDADLLIITNVEHKSASERFNEMRKKLGCEISLTIMPLSKWASLSQKKDRFYLEVVSNHVLLWGASILV